MHQGTDTPASSPKPPLEGCSLQEGNQPLLYRDFSKHGHVYLNNRQCQLTYVHGIGHILAKNLEKEISLIESSVSIPIRDAIVDSIPLKYAMIEQLDDLVTDNSYNLKSNPHFGILVSLPDALTAIQFMGQYTRDSQGLKKYGNWGGIANLKWISGSIMTPFIYHNESILIPTHTLTKMSLEGSEAVVPTRLSGWPRTKLLIETLKLSADSYNNTTPTELYAAYLKDIQKATRLTIHFHEVPY